MKYTNHKQAVDVDSELCLTIAMEECSELIQAISKAKRGKLDAENLAEEIADVFLTIEWVTEIYDIDITEIMKWKHQKENRVVERLNKGEFN